MDLQLANKAVPPAVRALQGEEFYQQNTAVAYSLRDTNDWRQQNSREKIERGVKFYGKADVDGESCSESSPAGTASSSSRRV